MRKLLLLRRVPIALMVLAIFACSSGFKPSLGGSRSSVVSRSKSASLLSDTVVASRVPSTYRHRDGDLNRPQFARRLQSKYALMAIEQRFRPSILENTLNNLDRAKDWVW